MINKKKYKNKFDYILILGKLSYTIYLIHLPFIIICGSDILDILPQPGNWRAIIVIIFSTGFSYLTWKFIENPILSYKLTETSYTNIMRSVLFSFITTTVILNIILVDPENKQSNMNIFNADETICEQEESQIISL